MKFSGMRKMLPVLIAGVSLLTACGNSKYQKQEFSSSAGAGQYVVTKPKIDIVIFQDNSDSVMLNGPIKLLKPKMQSFLSGLDSAWDYHFTVMPLLSTYNIKNKYVVASDCSTITASGVYQCLSPSQTNYFNSLSGDYGWINTPNSSIGSNDHGFQNTYSNLVQSGMKSSGFLRPDAALAVIVISNGEDIDGMSYKTRNDGYQELDYSTGVSTFDMYVKAFKTQLKGTGALSRFYSVVSSTSTSNCLGASAYAGKRYIDMANSLSSRAYNVCSSSALDSLLSSISAQMQTIVESVVFNYQVLDSQPDPSSIKVYKNGSTTPMANSAVDGWTYEGYKVEQPTSFFPTSGNPRTGYMIKLNGTAVYSGTDTLKVTYNKK